ncbi:MAG: Rrf2 family transcriptional regulator [Chloroflexota bacterium]|nr:Rrf2 family transcriptional regulator [Chloroflexota bacterium]
MIFSTRSEYGVMMLTDLAQHYGEGPLSLSDIAKHLSLTVPYLEQIVPALRKHGFVESVRGAKGGYVLATPPETIKMGAVIRALEDRIAVMGCAAEDNSAPNCHHENVCTATVLWLRVRDAIMQALDSTTLADLVPTRRTLSMALPAQVGGVHSVENKAESAVLAATTETNS